MFLTELGRFLGLDLDLLQHQLDFRAGAANSDDEKLAESEERGAAGQDGSGGDDDSDGDDI